jgi:uncharacterized protein (DUF1810 family)
MSELDRFKIAQQQPHNGFEVALGELKAGRKRGHWIWYMFPQLSGLGESSMSFCYGVNGVGEGVSYLRDADLRSRLLAVTGVVAEHVRQTPVPRLATLMGSDIDAIKLVSSMTLFGAVARWLSADRTLDAVARDECRALAVDAEAILVAAEKQGHPRCELTTQELARHRT